MRILIGALSMSFLATTALAETEAQKAANEVEKKANTIEKEAKEDKARAEKMKKDAKKAEDTAKKAEERAKSEKDKAKSEAEDVKAEHSEKAADAKKDAADAKKKAAEKVDESAKAKEDAAKKIENDLVALVEGIARERNRNEEWAKDAVLESVSATADKALEIGIIDLIARDRAELLEKLEGHQLVVDGKKVELRTKGSAVVEFKPALRNSFLDFLASPGVAALLVLIGVLGIMVEMYALTCASSSTTALASHTTDPPGASASVAAAGTSPVALFATLTRSPTADVSTSASPPSHATSPVLDVVCGTPATVTYARGATRSMRPRMGLRTTVRYFTVPFEYRFSCRTASTAPFATST